MSMRHVKYKCILKVQGGEVIGYGEGDESEECSSSEVAYDAQNAAEYDAERKVGKKKILNREFELMYDSQSGEGRRRR